MGKRRGIAENCKECGAQVGWADWQQIPMPPTLYTHPFLSWINCRLKRPFSKVLTTSLFLSLVNTCNSRVQGCKSAGLNSRLACIHVHIYRTAREMFAPFTLALSFVHSLLLGLQVKTFSPIAIEFRMLNLDSTPKWENVGDKIQVKNV